jgi:hypothetical protein
MPSGFGVHNGALKICCRGACLDASIAYCDMGHARRRKSDFITDHRGISYMTAHDFFLLFAAFGGFVIVPALLFWGSARLAHRKHSERRGPGIRPDVDSTDASSGDETKEATRSGKANEFLRWLNTAKRPSEISRLVDEAPIVVSVPADDGEQARQLIEVHFGPAKHWWSQPIPKTNGQGDS